MAQNHQTTVMCKHDKHYTNTFTITQVWKVL